MRAHRRGAGVNLQNDMVHSHPPALPIHNNYMRAPMHGDGFFDDNGNVFKKIVSNPVVQNIGQYF
jgi:hypothetical protein